MLGTGRKSSVGRTSGSRKATTSSTSSAPAVVARAPSRRTSLQLPRVVKKGRGSGRSHSARRLPYRASYQTESPSLVFIAGDTTVIRSPVKTALRTCNLLHIAMATKFLKSTFPGIWSTLTTSRWKMMAMGQVTIHDHLSYQAWPSIEQAKYRVCCARVSSMSMTSSLSSTARSISLL